MADEETTEDDELLAQVMRKLRVTWDDDDTAARVADIMETSAAALAERLGIPARASCTFEEAGVEKALFLNLCFYAWNDAEDEFWENYGRDVAQARRKWEVIQHAEEA